MSPAWDVGAAGSTDGNYTITVENDSGVEKEYAGTTRVADAVTEAAREAGLSSVIVKNASGVELQPSEGCKTLAQVGNLTLYPKSSGSF